MKVKIISDGTPRNTKVVNAETGEAIEMITAINWHIDGPLSLAKAELKFVAIPVEVVGETVDENDPKPVGPPNTLFKEWGLSHVG